MNYAVARTPARTEANIKREQMLVSALLTAGLIISLIILI